MVNRNLLLSKTQCIHFFSLHLQSILVVWKGMYVSLVGTQKQKEGWKYVTTRYGGLLVAPPPTGTTEMPLLCVDIQATQQIVSCFKQQKKCSFLCKVATSYYQSTNCNINANFTFWGSPLIKCIIKHCFMILPYLGCIRIQGQFPYPLHSLGEAMPQYWFGILDVLVESSHSRSAHPATTPFLIILVALMYLTGKFTFYLIR